MTEDSSGRSTKRYIAYAPVAPATSNTAARIARGSPTQWSSTISSSRMPSTTVAITTTAVKTSVARIRDRVWCS
ncbi:hypothetical protein TsocGM_08480 [Tautonia sociabilis]|uniref:Uncharacterized protein n=1 Tax=Tautonia sociabilis TaxID=2080755 RepID=A0A432ML64_9BACT|nr:hypothetical protein TsocGM_08480 [Tautonia sociabilis]